MLLQGESMNISVLELRRAEIMLNAFCDRRNRLVTRMDGRLRCRRRSDELFIGDSEPFRSIVKLSYEGNGWRVYVRLDSGRWKAYPHLPHADDLQAVIDEFEQAPLHVHWG